LAAVTEVFVRVRRLIAGARTEPGSRVVLLFYFSGHSDGEALELGGDRLTFSALRGQLASLGADVRVILVDSCKSGALLAAKGGRPGPGFQIRMTDELASTGEALLTSSAADEVALESREIAGSFFTHHLISGLRGAADTSGDGLVTLTEAYQYAYAHTIKTTGETVLGAQHPAYDYRLSGQGELVLSELGKRTATLELPSGFDRILVIDLSRDQVTAEVTADTRARIGVRPGRYAIHASRAGALFAGQVAVADGSRRSVRTEELTATRAMPTLAKGAPDPTSELIVAGGVGTGVASQLGAVPSLRFALVMPTGLSLALDAGSRAGTGFRETGATVLAGCRYEVSRGPWSTWIGLEAGGGAIWQLRPAGMAWSGVLSTAGMAGASLDVTPRWAISLEATLPFDVLRRDGQATVLFRPAGWLGIAVRL
ncbi:MAG TPA: caspase family protein, partial [Kofleriaceae bacterium]|nr:caspase family protein [Kofleriaceae bacterium]